MVLEVDETGKTTGNVISARRRQDPGIRRLSKDTTTTSSSTTMSPFSSNPGPPHTANAFYGNWQASAASSNALPSSFLVVRNAQPSDSLSSQGDALGAPYRSRSLTSPTFGTAVPASSTTANPLPIADDISESVYEPDPYDGIASTSAGYPFTERAVSGNSPPSANRQLTGDISDSLGAVMLTTEGIEEAAPSYDTVTGGHSGAFPEEKAAPRR